MHPQGTFDVEEDSDEGGGLFIKDAQNDLSLEKMTYIRNTRHPRTPTLDRYTEDKKYELHSLCFSSMGWSHCRKSMRKNDFGQYGAGLVLYFQFLKYLSVMMFLFTLLSLPSYVLFSSGGR